MMMTTAITRACLTQLSLCSVLFFGCRSQDSADVYVGNANDNSTVLDLSVGSGNTLSRDSSYKSVERVNWRGARITEKDADYVSHFPALKDIDIRDSSLSQEAIESLLSTKTLSTFKANQPEVPNRLVRKCNKDSGLRRLILNDTGVTDAQIEKFATCPKLEELQLGGSDVTDKGTCSLASAIQLKTLILSNTKVTSDGIACLIKLPALNELGLVGTKVDDNVVQYLKAMKDLQWVGLSRTRVSEKKLQDLRSARSDLRLGR